MNATERAISPAIQRSGYNSVFTPPWKKLLDGGVKRHEPLAGNEERMQRMCADRRTRIGTLCAWPAPRNPYAGSIWVTLDLPRFVPSLKLAGSSASRRDDQIV
jgi:hypothetical protein